MIDNAETGSDAVILIDSAGTATVFVGDDPEPRAEAVPGPAATRLLLHHANRLGRAVTVAIHDPSGRRTLQAFAPDGTVTTIEVGPARRIAMPSPVDPAPPARRHAPMAPTVLATAAVTAIALSVLSADRPLGGRESPSGDDRVISSEVGTEAFVKLLWPEASATPGRTPEPTPTADPSQTPEPTESPESDATISPDDVPENPPDGDAQPPQPDPPAPPAGLAVTERTGTSLSVSWSASAGAGVSEYAIAVDGVRTASVGGTTTTIGGLRPGVSYVIAVAAVGAGGAVGPYVSVTAATLDTEPPSAPGGLTVTKRTGTSLTVSWNQASDNVAVAEYAVYLDGRRSSTVGGTSATLTGLEPATAYEVAVAARDAAGNSSASATTKAETRDTIAPTKPGDLSARASITAVALEWTASTDNVGVAGYAVYLDGRKIRRTTSTSINLGGLKGATTYTMAVTAYDDTGNHSAPASVEIQTFAAP